MIKAGLLNKNISLISFDGGAWTHLRGVWGQITVKERVIYSPYTLAVPGAEIIIRHANITPAYAFNYAGQHYMITEPIEEIENGAGLKIIAAAVKLTECTHEVPSYTMGENNRPVAGEPVTTTFSGILAQKYNRWQQQEPNATTEDALILTTPKAMVLQVGDVVNIGEKSYPVRVCYLLDAYRNDYEVVKEADA